MFKVRFDEQRRLQTKPRCSGLNKPEHKTGGEEKR
jgi:hypothetical protein